VFDRNLENFFEYKADSNFNQKNTLSISRIKILIQRSNLRN